MELTSLSAAEEARELGAGSTLCIGEALIDVVHAADGTVTEHPGGSPMNVAVGLSRLGHQSELATWIGRDAHGTVLTDHLTGNGVSLAPGSAGAARTSTAAATLAEDGSATYEFDLEWALPPVASLTRPSIVHTGSIGGVLAPGADNVRMALATFRGAAAISYDPNARPSLMGEASQALEQVESLVNLADLVKVSDEDVAWLIGDDSEQALIARLRAWLDAGPGLVVVTRGGKGATALTRGGLRVDVESERVDVVDTVGAGDSFMAGLDDGLWRTGLLTTAGIDSLTRPSDALADADEETLTRVLRRCARIAAITVSRAGANPPTLDELGEDVAL